MAMDGATGGEGGYQRWLPPSMGVVCVEPPAQPAPVLPTVADLEALEQQAREEGFAAGHAEGLAAARVEVLEQLARFQTLCTAAAQPLAALDNRTEQELAELALAVARKVIEHELAVAPALVVQAIRRGADALPSASRGLRVRLHPDDAALVRELGDAPGHWQLQADATLQRGDCVLETASSRLDARLQTRLAAVIDAAFADEAPREAVADTSIESLAAVPEGA